MEPKQDRWHHRQLNVEQDGCENSSIGPSKTLKILERRIQGGTGRLGRLKAPNEPAAGCLDDREDRSSDGNAARTTYYYRGRKSDDKGNIEERLQ